MSETKIDKYFSPVNRTPKRPRQNSSPDSVNSQCSSGNNMDNLHEKVGELTKHELMSELTAVIGNLLDNKLANVATKNDLASLSEKVSKIDAENVSHKEEINNLKSQNKIILNKLLDLESRSRRNNLIFKGLKVTSNTRDFKYLVSSFVSDKFGNNQVWINRAHPLGNQKDTVIAHIPYDADIEYIMSRVSDLKGSGYSVFRDYPREVRIKRACLAAVRDEVERVAGRRKMPLVFDHLTINRKRFTWEEGRLMAGQQDGVQELNSMFRHDFSAFVAEVSQQPIRKTRENNSGGGTPPSQQQTPAATYSSMARGTTSTTGTGTNTGGGGGDGGGEVTTAAAAVASTPSSLTQG